MYLFNIRKRYKVLVESQNQKWSKGMREKLPREEKKNNFYEMPLGR